MQEHVRNVITNKTQKLALIHVAKNQCALSDDLYRELLRGSAGISSARDIEYEDQFQDIILAFSRIGFRSFKAQGITTSRPKWKEQWGCTDGQRAKIEVMWRTVARHKENKSLKVFIKRIVKVDHPRFLLSPLAVKVIQALAAMMEAQGYDPETGRRKAHAQEGESDEKE